MRKLTNCACKFIPFIAGGTGFYFVNFINGLPQTPKSVPEIKKQLTDQYDKEGPEKMWRILQKSDPVTAARLPVNDRQRVIRAIEVYRISGKPLSSFKPGSGRQEMYEFLIIGLKQDREKLYDSINRRVDAMFAAGLTDEIRKLIKMGYTFSDPGMKGIGYSEFAEYADNPDKADLTLLKEEIAKNTRRYAKRQITFFSKINDTIWIDAENIEQLTAEVTRFISDFSV